MLMQYPPIGSLEWFVFLVAGTIALLILMTCCCRLCRRKPEVIKEIQYIERPAAPKRVVERERIVERVLIMCPYCGHKNEQGMPKCGECGADL